MEDLLVLDGCSPREDTNPSLHLSQVVTALRVQEWRRELALYPDKRLAENILQGLTQGFRIGFAYGAQLKAARGNICSASEHPSIIEDYIQGEQAAGRIVGPLLPGGRSIHINPIGVIPKKHSAKWRLIVDLSSPQGGA